MKILLLFCALMGASMLTQKRGWRGIVPLHSTREDVERVTGPAMTAGGLVYDLKNERVNVSYSAVPCKKGWPYGWNVPPETVTRIEVFPKARLKIIDLNLDLANYTKFANPVLQGQIHYTNSQEGLSIRIEGEDVVSFEYFPAARDRGLMCPETVKREISIANGESASLTPVMNYSDVSVKEQQIRLRMFFDQLKNYPSDSRIHIIAYGGREACPNEALLNAKRAKNYLVRLGVRKQRILTIDGGYTDPLRNEFYVIARGQPKPISNPEIYPRDIHVRSNCKNKRSGRRN